MLHIVKLSHTDVYKSIKSNESIALTFKVKMKSQLLAFEYSMQISNSKETTFVLFQSLFMLQYYLTVIDFLEFHVHNDGTAQ